MNLIEAFAPFDEDLREFTRLQRGKHYFGEYLFQGALNIAGQNTIVSAQDMIDKGLLLLRPEFHASVENSDCSWANDVVAMYDMLDRDLAKPQPCQAHRLVLKALHVAYLFGRDQRMHVAMSLVAIVPGQIDAKTIAQAFQEADFSRSERLQLSQTWLRQGMSVLVRFREVRGMVHTESYQHDLLETLLSAHNEITRANEIAVAIQDECTSDHRQPLQLAVCEEKIQMMVGCLNSLRDVLTDVQVSL